MGPKPEDTPRGFRLHSWFPVRESDMGQQRKCACSFDHFVGAAEQRRGDLDAERLGGLQVDCHFEFGRQ
jgi:hypothetical protein